MGSTSFPRCLLFRSPGATAGGRRMRAPGNKAVMGRKQSRAQSFSSSLSAVGRRRPTADKEPEKLWARDWGVRGDFMLSTPENV